jgi:hypothetical protein
MDGITNLSIADKVKSGFRSAKKATSTNPSEQGSPAPQATIFGQTNNMSAFTFSMPVGASTPMEKSPAPTARAGSVDSGKDKKKRKKRNKKGTAKSVKKDKGKGKGSRELILHLWPHFMLNYTSPNPSTSFPSICPSF